MKVLPLDETPEFCRCLLVTPGASRGIMRAESPAAPDSGEPVRTAATTKSDQSAFVIHFLLPLTRNDLPSEDSVAVVRMFATSLPATISVSLPNDVEK